MSVPVPDPEALRHLAQLAALELGEADLPGTLEELERILGFMAGITAVDLERSHRASPSAPPTSPPPDDAVAGSPPIDLTRLAPLVQDGLVLCPPVPHQVLPPE